MKKFFFILLFFAFHSYLCNAQHQTISDSNKIEKLKKEYLTRELELSPVESRAFWPVYDRYNAEIRRMWMEYKDQTLFREKAAAIKDKYRPAFIQLLHSHERANNVFRAERAYREMLKKELQERRKN